MCTIRVQKLSIAAGAALAVLLAGSPAGAVFIGNIQGGTDFPEGAVSFADAVASFDPVIKNGQPSARYTDPADALGLPDYTGDSCATSVPCESVTLGDGGSITLRFLDNVLTGSDSSALDLWVFEVGPDIEDTFVEISTDGVAWTSVGKVFGSTAGIDLDAFGFGTTSAFSWVRLTDDPNEGDQTGGSVGADIDALGAISTQVIPEPGTLALVAAGALALAVRRRRA